MGLQHGKDQALTVAPLTTVDPPVPGTPVTLTGFIDNGQLVYAGDVHTVTTANSQGKRKRGGLKESTFTCGGVYDSATTDTPKAVFEGRAMDSFQVTWMPEGVGSGKAQRQFIAVLANYTETAPVADFIRWTAEFQVDGVVDHTPQA